MDSLKRQFGRRLKAIRNSRGQTQEEFAELVGISVDFLSLIERGINSPSFARIDQISRRLNVNVASLFTFSAHLQPNERPAKKRRSE